MGFGRVGVLGFDPAALQPRPEANTAQFWVQHLGALLGDSGKSEHRAIMLTIENAIESDEYSDHSYELGIANRGLGSVFEYLLNIPRLKPLSIWWVILLLSTLAILLGPVDYLVLKRLDRQPLTWITSAACIVLFTVGAYFGVKALRSGAAQVRAVSVLDSIEGTNSGWSTMYMGLFAPESDEYRLAKLKPNQWWSSIAPAQGYLFAYNRHSSSRNIFCMQHDGSNLPNSLPINIWSMQCMMSESPSRQIPISATVKRVDDELVVVVTNRSDYPIRRGYVRLDENKVVNLGSVPARATKEFRGRTHTRQAWEKCLGKWPEHHGPSSPKFTRDAAFFAGGSLQRTRAIEEYLQRGAAVICVEYEQMPLSFSVADRKSQDSHIQLVRLVVFPQECF